MGKQRLPTGERKTPYSITLRPSDIEKLEKWAKELGVTPVELTRNIILERLELEEQK